MKQTNKLLMMVLTITSISILGCKKDDTAPSLTPGAYDAGVFITNEGQFGSGTGSVSFYNRTTGVVTNTVFEAANDGATLGNIVQSMGIYNSKGYIVVNNANKVVVVNGSDFKFVASITAVTQPRYFLGIDNSKAYVSEWGIGGVNGAIKVINLANNTVASSIGTGKGAEKMVKSGNYVYVSCQGGFGKDSVVSVINTVTDAVVSTISVGASPSGIEIDANGKIWVLCGGEWNSSYTSLNKTGKLVRIDPNTNKIDQTFDFTSTTSKPSNLTINAAKNKLYYNYQGRVYSQDITATALSNTIFINKNFYGIGVDPNNDYVYASDAGNYTSAGYVFRYNNTGAKIDSMKVGIAPGGFCFR